MLLLPVVFTGAAQNRTKNTLSGFIKEAGSGEFMIGASIYIPKYKTGTMSNVYGFYSITLPADTFDLIVSYVGYSTKAYRVDLRQPAELNIEMVSATNIKEVVITADKYQKISEQTRMSVIEIPVEQVRDIPALLGEKDVLKVIQLLPGVQKGSEGNAGLYVRGGGPDQNLIILDDAIVYNAFHLFGFFSLFNGDALRSIELTKGGFPARYGGRLSSVLDMSMKEGNKESYHGEVGIGLISSRAILEGPIQKKKSSFIVSARRTYIDVLTRPLLPANNDGGYYFYDLNAKVNYEFSDKDKIYLSSYFGRDHFFFENTVGGKFSGGVTWGNATATLRWNHLYNKKLFSNTALIFSDYSFENYIESSYDGLSFKLNYSSGIRDWGLKHDLDFRPSPKHTVKAGVHAIYHTFTPNALVIKDNNGAGIDKVNQIYAWENALYAEDEIKLGLRTRLNPGVRITQFAPAGKQYINIEPRLNAAYQLKPDVSVKASYAIMNQYVHLLSNTGVGLPTDLWVPSTDIVKPQRSSQVAAGIVKDFDKQEFSVSLEGYYKTSSNIIAYREGASFLGIDAGEEESENFNWENNVTSGQGWSYGAELFIQKKTGRFTGWIGYTLSWTELQFDQLNNGEKFYARYDRRHDLSLVGIYKLKKEEDGKNGITLSSTWVYGTGNAITLPIGEYKAPVHQPGNQSSGDGKYGGYISQYTGRNQFRMGAYHRWDIGVKFHKKNPNTVRTIEVSLYNVYSRQNPFFYYIGSKSGGFSPTNGNERVLKQVSLFPIIPSISWSLKF